MNLLQTKNLTLSYGSNIVLENINLNITSGDFISIIGKNGSGKSTLVKALAGLNENYSGEILFLKKDISSYSELELAKYRSWVAQQLHNILPISGKDFLELSFYPQKELTKTEKKKRFAEMTKLTECEYLLTKKITQMSGGEKSLLFITRALLQTEKLIILDEPIANLDINNAIKIMQLLKKLNKKGTTVITVLHDLNFALQFSKKVITLKNQKIHDYDLTSNVMTEDNLSKIYDVSLKKVTTNNQTIIYSPLE